MNSVSWLIFAASSLESLQLGVILICIGAGIALLVRVMVHHIDTDELLPGAGRRAWIIAGVFLLAVMIPSRSTIMMIAASELGEKVAKTDDAKVLYDLLSKKVREALK